MKKLLLLALLLCTGVAFGQHSSPAGHFRKWVDIPSAPALTAPVTITPANATCCGPGIFNFTLVTNTPRHVKTSGLFTAGLALRQWDGTAGSEYTIVNTAGDVYGTTGAGQNHGVQNNGTGNYLYFYGLSPTAPMVTTGENGFQLPSASVASGGAHLIIQNAVAKSTHASGSTFNFGINGTNYYENINVQFFRSFNAGEEGIIYIGNTGASYNGTNYINIAVVKNNFSYNSSRECTQFEHINLLTARNNTGKLNGQTGGAGQNNSLQAHDLGPGSDIGYSIYDGSPSPFNLGTHGTRIHDCYFGFTLNFDPGDGNTFSGFMARTDNSYYAGSTRLTGDSLIIENCYFNFTGAGTLNNVFEVEERVANVIVRNCTFSTNITHIMRDHRVAGFSNTLTGDIGDHGNVSAAITAPVYVTNYNNPDMYLVQGLIDTSSPYYALHFGYRTP